MFILMMVKKGVGYLPEKTFPDPNYKYFYKGPKDW